MARRDPAVAAHRQEDVGTGIARPGLEPDGEALPYGVGHRDAALLVALAADRDRVAHVVDLLKKERGDFGSAKPAAERERDDGGVALRADVAVGLGGLEKTSRLGGLEGAALRYAAAAHGLHLLDGCIGLQRHEVLEPALLAGHLDDGELQVDGCGREARAHARLPEGKYMVVGQHLPLHGVKVGGAEEARDLVEKLDDALLRLTVAERHDVGLGGIEEVAAARHDDGSGKRGVPEAKGAVEDAAGIVPDGTMTNDGRSQHDERTKNNGHERWANPEKGVVPQACARNSRVVAKTINVFLETLVPAF